MELETTSSTARQAMVAAGVTGAALLLTVAAAAPAVAALSNGSEDGARHSAAGQKGMSAQHRAGHAHGRGNDATGEDADETADDETTDADQEPAADDADDTAGADEPAGQDGDSDEPNGRAHSHAPAPTGGQSDGHNPPGNNGTVFIHDVAGDFSPHNVPHVPCTFYADFFGFDEGQQVTVSFAGQAPTGMGTPLGGSWTGTVSDDEAGGAGNDFDLELPFSADALGVTDLGAPHPQQGYHVKMTVLTNEPGGKKSKVFWIAPCTDTADTAGTTDETDETGETAPGTATEGSATEGTDTSVEGTDVEAGTAEGGMAAASGTSAPAGEVPTTVLGERFSRGALGKAAAAGVGSLPFTGSEVGGLLAIGTAALGGGAALTIAGRRRRTAGVSSAD